MSTNRLRRHRDRLARGEPEREGVRALGLDGDHAHAVRHTGGGDPGDEPPPPQATTIVSTSGTSSRISSPTVPAPAITTGSLNG